MKDVKRKALAKEIAQYLPHDDTLSAEQKQRLTALCPNPSNQSEQTVYDYFYSHLDEEGNPVSLEIFLSDNPTADKTRFEKANEIFLKRLFASQPPLFFVDVDNTLTDDGFLSKEKIDFLSTFDQSHRVVLTTGKAYPAIQSVMEECNLQNNYASCLNGSVLVQNGKTECIAKVGAISKTITDLFADDPFDCVVYYEDGIRLLKPLTQKNLDLLKKFNESYQTEDRIDFSRVVKVLFFIYKGETDKEDLVRQKIAPFSDLVCMRTAGHTFEVLHKSQHKGNTVKIISQLLNHHYRATVGVGDSMNDFQLLNYVGKPLVVSTADKELSKTGYQVAPKDRNTDIVKVIKRYQ